MSKQSNEVASQARVGDPGMTSSIKESRSNRPNRDRFLLAKQHAESLGISDKVSDGIRTLLMRYDTSPIKRLLDTMHDRDAPEDAKDRAAEKLLPYLHSKVEVDKEDLPPDPNRPSAPSLNLTLNVNARKKKTP